MRGEVVSEHAYPALRSEEPLCGAGQLQGGERKRAAASTFMTAAIPCPTSPGGAQVGRPWVVVKLPVVKVLFPP